LVPHGIGQNVRDFLLEEMPSSGRCAEIGVDEGDFSRRILEINRPAELHLIDPWEYRGVEDYVDARYGGDRGGSQERMDEVYQAVRERFAADIAAGRVHVHRMTSGAAAEEFPSKFFDWVYIDGNHLYEYVKRDLAEYFPKIKVGGYLTGDDYGVEGWWDDGVTRAVDEFIERPGVEAVMFREHQFVLRRS
jgi:hypothetical protein